jgi:hypothetical protein
MELANDVDEFECETSLLAKKTEARQHFFPFLVPLVYWIRE